MPDAIALLSTRHSTPAAVLDAPGPGPDELRTLLSIASRVPDHGKLAPWRFVVLRGPARAAFVEKLAAIAAEGTDREPAKLENEFKRFTQSPVIVAVVSRAAPHPKIPEWEQVLSVGAACMNLVTAATAMGYGAQWLTGWAAYDARAMAALGLSSGERVAGFVHIGTPSTDTADRPRPALEAIVTEWTGAGR